MKITPDHPLENLSLKPLNDNFNMINRGPEITNSCSPKIINKDIFVVMPAYNESKTIKKVINELKDKELNLVIIDDGSADETYNIAKNTINTSKSSIYRHVLNRGLGAALKTGIEAALKEGAEIIVTFDADGQHHPEDIIPVCKPIIEGKTDFVIGTRNFSEMPKSKQFGNTVMNILTRMFYGINVGDSQSGLRAFNRKAAEVIEINSRGYGVSSEIIGEMKKYGLRIGEVPIKTIYTDYSMSKGTNLTVGLKILFKLIINIFRRVLS
ncbi:glycosyltransferase family 2 protein [Methanobacterium sp. ACI-7]|uniref:glycosyltransferase family 2 protein n=1 Tax=unclassified Methanobacterium TaxID=2627676 RepID=UPI0039C2FB82